MKQRLTWSVVAAAVSAGQAQFYQNSHQFGTALATSDAENGTWVYIHIEAPTSYQWAGIGTGDKMDGSFMILIQQSGSDSGNKVVFSLRSPTNFYHQVHVTARSANGHDEPEQVNVSFQVLASKVKDQRMSADIKWVASDASTFSTVNPNSSKQAWIWAVGPHSSIQPSSSDNDKRRRDGGAGEIDQHSSYGKDNLVGVFASILRTKIMAGIFFADMTKATQASSTPLILTGTSNIAVKPQGESYKALVVLHALLLGIAFVIVFPLGAIGLRTLWKLSFTIHWILQLLASGASIIGLAVAVALSIIGIEYNDFDETHQILGFCVIALLVAQITGGIWHHINFKRLGRRTIVSYGHMLLGRILIYGGMVNAIL